jgi:hypothetical protein
MSSFNLPRPICSHIRIAAAARKQQGSEDMVPKKKIDCLARQFSVRLVVSGEYLPSLGAPG